MFPDHHLAILDRWLQETSLHSEQGLIQEGVYVGGLVETAPFNDKIQRLNYIQVMNSLMHCESFFYMNTMIVLLQGQEQSYYVFE